MDQNILGVPLKATDDMTDDISADCHLIDVSLDDYTKPLGGNGNSQVKEVLTKGGNQAT